MYVIFLLLTFYVLQLADEKTSDTGKIYYKGKIVQLCCQ
jgi:hypothetical protein